MPDEYYERYRHLTHEELHRQLMAGTPRQVAKAEAAWQRAHEAVASAAATLRTHLDRLSPQWEGPGSREFQHRMGLCVAFAQKLGDEGAAIRTGLDVMGKALLDAQRLAEPVPFGAETQDARAPLPGVLDVSFGHTMATDERARSRERLVTLVAHLAAEYTLADHGGWPASMPEPPPGLPGMTFDQAGAGLAPVDGVEVPEAAPPTMTGGTVLAGAELTGAGGPGLATTALAGSPVPTGSTPSPAVMLGGALPGLSAAQPAGVRAGEGKGGAGTTGPAGTAVPPPVLGGGFGGRPDSGYAITDSRLAGDVTGWASADHVAWSEHGDSPPPVLGDRPAAG